MEIVEVQDERIARLRSLSDPTLSLSDMKLEEETVHFIYQDISDIKTKFVDIGFRLSEANARGYYKRLGFSTIEEFAETLFDMKKSQAYQLMGICEKFCDGGMRLLPEYEKFSQSQLVEMLSMYPVQVEKITPDLTVSEIREFKKAIKSDYGCVNPRLTAREHIERYHEKQTTDVVSNKDYNRAMKFIDGIINKKVQTSGKNPDVLPGQIEVEEVNEPYDGYALDEEKEKESIERQAEKEIEDESWRSDHKSAEWQNNYLSALTTDSTDYPSFKEALKESTVETLKCALKLNWRKTAKEKIDAEIRRREKADSEDLPEEKPSYVLQTPPTGKLTFKNNDARKDWFENYEQWGKWIEIHELGITFYRYDFLNGCSIIVETAHENYGYLENDKGQTYRRSVDIIDPKKDPIYNTHFYGGVSAVVDWLSKHKEEI